MVPMRNNNNSVMTQNWLPSIFDDFFGDDWNWLTTTQKSTPAINVTEDENAYNVSVAVPGITKDDCRVRVNNDVLSIKVEKNSEAKQDDKKRRFLRKEFSYSRFEQSFTLPDNVDGKHIQADVQNGVLNISLPKTQPQEEKSQWQDVEIQ